MIGYHYTTYSNYLQIKKKGLEPYHINKIELTRIGIKQVNGIWLFARRQKRRKLVGTLFWQVGTKNKLKIVELRCKICKFTLLKGPRNEDLNITHKGNLNEFKYHFKELSRITITKIPKENIELLCIYDFTELVDQQQRKYVI